jgi:3',5'-cyclic-AMP phosphodiesterase
MKIAHITDLHIEDGLSKHFEINSIRNFEHIISDIDTKNVDYVICTGDYGSISGLQIIKNKILENFSKYIFCLGNHDQYEDLINIGIINKIEQLNRKIEFDDYVFIFFDTSNGSTSKSHSNWLIENIEPKKVNLVFTHYPLLESNTKQIDKEIGLRNKERLEEVLNKDQNQIFIFSGHYHRSDKIKLNQIIQYICPSGIMQIKEENGRIKTDSFNYGYNIIEIIKKKVSIDTILFKGTGKDNPWV